MATNAWKCYKHRCEHIGTAEEFSVGDDYKCPKCGSEDCFPHRIFRCLDCGFEGDQMAFFGQDSLLDADPIEEKWLPEGIHPKPGEDWLSCASQRMEQVS